MSTIAEKLKLNKYHEIVIQKLPKSVAPLFEEVDYHTEPSDQTDFLMTFALSLDEMKQQIEAVNRDKLLAQSGYLYIAYPKVQSKHYDGVRRDDIFPYLHVDETTGQMGETHLKFSWMLKLDEDFTLVGLQWLTAAPRQQNKPSQRVADCEGRLPELEEMLATYPSTLQQFRELTPGYRREWARYVFSPRTAATQASHFDKMIEVLEAGYSSVELYRQAQS